MLSLSKTCGLVAFVSLSVAVICHAYSRFRNGTKRVALNEWNTWNRKRQQKQYQDFMEECRTMMTDLCVVLVSGSMGTGKNYLTKEYLLPAFVTHGFSVTPFSFADGFKTDSIVFQGLKYDEAYDHKTYESRRILQLRGTEHGRKLYGEDIWVVYALARLRSLYDSGLRAVVITDARFPNELQRFHHIFPKCATIRIRAPSRHRERVLREARGNDSIMETLMQHESESALDNYDDLPPPCYIVSNDPCDSEPILKEQLEYVVKTLVS